MVVTVKTCN